MLDYHWDKCGFCKENIIGPSHTTRLWTKKIKICSECHETERLSHIEGRKARRFWDEYYETHKELPHICDFSIEELRSKHKNALNLIQKYDPMTIGTMLAGEYYDNVWSSRSCSGHIARLVGIDGEDDYLSFYCGSSNYYYLVTYGDEKFISEFRTEMERDKNDV